MTHCLIRGLGLLCLPFRRWLVRLPRCCIFILVSLAAGCSTATIVPQDTAARVRIIRGESDFTWGEDSGWVQPEGGDWGDTTHLRTESKKALDADAYADALVGFLELEKRLTVDDAALGVTRFWIGECYYHLDNYAEAHRYFTLVYRQAQPPQQDVLKRAFLRLYDIAMAYLQGKASCSFLGISYNCPRHGIEILVGEDGLITEYPYLAFADDAILEIAQYYYEGKQFPEAIPFYQRLVRDYPESKWLGTAQYLLAMCFYLQIRGTDYDERIIRDAERHFRRYLHQFPRGPHAETARQNLREISEKLAAKYLKIAKFYLHESKPRSARIYLGFVLDRYTTSTAAREARQIQRQLDRLQIEVGS